MMPWSTQRTKRRLNSMGKHNRESGVVKAVMQYLTLDSRVAEVRRQNNGAMVIGGRYVQFVRGLDNKPVTVLDIAGYLTDGRGFELECKKRIPRKVTVERWKGTLPSDLTAEARRYLEQDARIEFLIRNGAVAGFVTGVDDAKTILDWAFRPALRGLRALYGRKESWPDAVPAVEPRLIGQGLR